jgi:hypothetical protein
MLTFNFSYLQAIKNGDRISKSVSHYDDPVGDGVCMYEKCATSFSLRRAENALSEQKERILKDGEHNPKAQDDCTLSLN